MDPKTQFLTNDPQTRKKWARDLFKQVPERVEFNELIGKGSDAVIEQKIDLAKGEGDTIKFSIRRELTGEGIVGDMTQEGNEEKLKFRQFQATIEERGHAVDTGGKMEEQRVPINLMSEGKDALQEWWGQWLSNYMFAVICGRSDYRVASKVFADLPEEPSALTHMFANNQTDEASIGSADIVDLDFLDAMKQSAEMPQGADNYKVRPIMIGGKPHFRIILHTLCFDQLRKNLNAGQLGDLLRDAGKLKVANVEYVYNGLLISKTDKIWGAPGTEQGKDGTYRNVLLGAQSAVQGWGGAGESKSSTMSFVPYTRDAERYTMIRGGGILGMKKVKFDGVDSNIITGSAYGARLQ